MSLKNPNRNNKVHIDLTLLPIKKQVYCIWLSKVIQNHDELQKKTGINPMYIKPILENKAYILQLWKDGIVTNSKKNLSSKQKEDNNGIDILLLEWVRRSILNKIVVYKPDIERQAENLKHVFKVPKYRIRPTIWNNIKFLIDNRRNERILPQFIPRNILKIFKTNGKQLLKRETYLRFSNNMATTTKSKIKIDDEQSDDLILIEPHIECIDVTDDCNTSSDTECMKIEATSSSPKQHSDNNNTGYVKREPPSSTHSDHTSTSYLTEETLSDFPKLLPLNLDLSLTIKEESNENYVKSLNIFPEVLFKKEFGNSTQGNSYKTAIKNETTINNNKTKNSNANVNIIKADEEDNAAINSDLDGQDKEFFDNTDERPNENIIIASEKIQLINIEQDFQNNVETKTEKSDNENEHKCEIDDNNQEEILKVNGMQSGFEVDEFESDETEIEIIDGDANEIIANNDFIFPNISVADIKTELSSDKSNNKVNEIIIKPAKEVKEECPEIVNVDDNDENDNDDGDNNCSDSETEVVYEIEGGSDDDMQNELQQIINNYRNKTNQDIDAKSTNSSDVQHDAEKIITVLEIMSEDDVDSVDEDELNVLETITTNKSHKRKRKTSNINVEDELSETNTEKRERIETISDTKELFDPNLPSTSRLAAANISSSLQTSSKITPGLTLTPQELKHEIIFESKVDAVKYLQNIQKYLLSQNDEHAVKLILNLQMAFLNSNIKSTF